ncbi:hypothetical protein MMC28_009085 [Mycoblastus sanguinarius]|nr:hypothetical protein [Mycoblastus sanguinarius]
MALMTLLISLLIVPIEAAEARGSGARRSTGHFVQAGEHILFDHSPAPQPALHRRQGGGDLFESSSSTGSPKTHSATTKVSQQPSTTPVVASSIAAPTDTASPTTTSSNASGTSIDSAPTDSSSSLPKPFDAGLGTNYTQPSCPTFLKSLINNDTFTSCLPFSLLLQNSLSFFQASRSVESITTTLNASCNIVFPVCSSLMSSFARTMVTDTACGEDFKRQNPIVRQAYNGFLAYDVLYNASCTHSTPSPANNNSANYCFADAVTNTSSPTDSYVYYLPLGVQLPAGTMPTCDTCLQNIMSMFAKVASNKSQPLNLDYMSAATLINEGCGPNFVNANVPNASGKSSSSVAAKSGPVGWLSTFAVLVGVAQVLASL